MSTVTCHTTGCPNTGIPLQAQTIWTDPDTGETQPVPVVCGECGEPITDIAEPEPREETP